MRKSRRLGILVAMLGLCCGAGTGHAASTGAVHAVDYGSSSPAALALMHLSPLAYAGVGAMPVASRMWRFQTETFSSRAQGGVASPQFIDQSLLLVKTGLSPILPGAPAAPMAVAPEAAPLAAASEAPPTSRLALALQMLASQAYHWAAHPLSALEAGGDAAVGANGAADLAADMAQEGQADDSGSHWFSARSLAVDAMKFIGAPYRWGGMSPAVGFDCSGFVKYVLAKFDIHVPRTSYAQAASLHRVSRIDLKPGDLVFFNTMRRPFSHVGIYIGHQRFVSAQTPRSGVQVASLDDPYWAARYDGARRLPHAAAALGDGSSNS
ncbi:C40 family peptidase [Acidithiobacillus sulfuriphilus]|uniref:C40 family peptidase n=2 Tax=Acidithiobacillus sulfuriphilus TaxID=1867749 RepID=A0ACD5HSK3_9PROT